MKVLGSLSETLRECLRLCLLICKVRLDGHLSQREHLWKMESELQSQVAWFWF